ncbi:Sensor histidine kinase GraS [Peribacillus sp. Bi96]|uniref:sensor histidine kinase n=1 Tax=unclassified Peribacillus TaxID=2675266 RepID=UPI001DD53A5B|nr:sensor histidine kinase [Peribacillus sp. Bi96]CAH0258404.1 Sensor histidine kinase GraS [Peribacillus sp. Bi96]
MKFKSYIKDRLYFIFYTVLLGSLLIITYAFSVLEAGNHISISNIIYLFTLAMFMMLLFLAIDYIRHYRFLNQLGRMKQEAALTFEYAEAFMNPMTNEHKLWIELFQQMNRATIEQLQEQIKQKEQYELLIHQWVHQMKTPVSVISLLIQEGKRTFSDEAMKDYLKEIEDENDRFRRGLEIILHGARLQRFSEDVKSERIDLINLVKQVINEEKKQFIQRFIYPKLETEHENVYVHSDRKWLHFAISQVAYNALKYSRQGAHDSITFRIVEKESEIYLSIMDQGIGIVPHDIKRVFDPFFTGENGRTQQESTGMGLYLVKEIVNKFGHEVTIQSTVSVGTTVEFLFKTNTLHER